MAQQGKAALRTQLKFAFNRLNTQIWNNNDDETTRDAFEQVALRHIYATTTIQKLPYNGECFASETMNPTTWTPTLEALADRFFTKYKPVVWNIHATDVAMVKKALREYFQILLQLDGEDELIKPILRQDRPDPFE